MINYCVFKCADKLVQVTIDEVTQTNHKYNSTCWSISSGTEVKLPSLTNAMRMKCIKRTLIFFVLLEGHLDASIFLLWGGVVWLGRMWSD